MKLAILRKTLVVAVAGSLAPLTVSCSTGSLNPAADRDGNGGVSPSEFDAYMKKRIFDEFDQNRDGFVTMPEWRRLNPDGPAATFESADRKGDGRVSRAESDAHMDRTGSLTELFKKIDSDGNGLLSEAEIAAFQARMKSQPGTNKLDQLKQAATTS